MTVVQKIDFMCVSCKYKFTSAKAECPYCGDYESVLERGVTLNELLTF